MSTASPVTMLTLDSAYTALEEVFPGHPLMPALRMEYLQGVKFDSIGREKTIYGPSSEHNRARSLNANSSNFWHGFARYMKISYKNYLSWVQEIKNMFFQAIAKSCKDGKEQVRIMDRIRKALVRDFRYFGFHEQAKQLEEATLTARGQPAQVVHKALDSFLETRDTETGKPVKEGFSLSKRLCDPYRPLVLKCLCDLIKGQDVFAVLESDGRIPDKYRLFWRNEENTKDWDQMVEDNLSGGIGGEAGNHTLGNKWLSSQYGLAFMGAVAQLVSNTGTHTVDTNFVCQAFFYANYDDWFERTLHEMVKEDASQPGKDIHVSVISSNPRHYFNVGRFKRNQQISAYMLPVINQLNQRLHTWGDSGILAKNVLDVIQGRRVGSGSGAGDASTLAEQLKKKHEENLPKVHSTSYEEEIAKYQTGGN